jgi:hypothetical protein
MLSSLEGCIRAFFNHNALLRGVWGKDFEAFYDALHGVERPEYGLNELVINFVTSFHASAT